MDKPRSEELNEAVNSIVSILKEAGFWCEYARHETILYGLFELLQAEKQAKYMKPFLTREEYHELEDGLENVKSIVGMPVIRERPEVPERLIGLIEYEQREDWNNEKRWEPCTTPAGEAVLKYHVSGNHMWTIENESTVLPKEGE